MRSVMIALSLTLAFAAVTLVTPAADAASICVDNSPTPKVVNDCDWYLVCYGQYCVDYPCRYCMPF